jgi:hypothetical protein
MGEGRWTKGRQDFKRLRGWRLILYALISWSITLKQPGEFMAWLRRSLQAAENVQLEMKN